MTNNIILNTIITRATLQCMKLNIHYYKINVLGYTWTVEKVPNVTEETFIHNNLIKLYDEGSSFVVNENKQQIDSRL
jgi:hypothetical protein